MSATLKRTSFMRYQRVFDILQGDNLLKKRLSKNMAAVCRPDQTHKEFPFEVVYVTDKIHEQGLDAYTLAKIEVIRSAHRLLVANPVPPPPVAEPAADPKPEKAVKPKPAKASKPEKAVKPKVEKPTEKPKPKPKDALPKATATAEPSPAAVEPSQTGANDGNGVAAAPVLKTPPAFIRPFIPHVPGIAIMNCLYAARQLLEPHLSTDSDAKNVCNRLDELIDELHRRTVLPSAETQSTTTG